MTFISGIISIIIRKNTLCTNKIRMIYFCPSCVNFLPENVFFKNFFGGRQLPPSASQARAPMAVDGSPRERIIYISSILEPTKNMFLTPVKN